MDTSKLCMYCMQDNQGQDICPHCGKNAAAPLIANHLTPGEILGGRFLVGAPSVRTRWAWCTWPMT